MAPWENLHPIILSPDMEEIVGQTDLFNLGMATKLGEEKFNSNLLNFTLKINLVSHPAHA